MSCQKFKEEIEEAARGATLGAAAASHLAVCGECRALREERESLRGLVASLARVEAPADFEFRLRARIARAESAGGSRARWRGFVPSAAWVAVAACLVAALALFIHTPTREQVEPTADARGAADNGKGNDIAKAATPNAASSESRSDEGGAEVPDFLPAKNTSRKPVARRGQRLVVPREVLEQMAESQPEPPALGVNSLSAGGLKIYTASPIPLPVNVPEQPLEMQFTDSHGSSRVVSVDPVTFGARSLPARRGRVTNAKFTPTQGVW